MSVGHYQINSESRNNFEEFSTLKRKRKNVFLILQIGDCKICNVKFTK